jgi:protein-S-isoprenylcysteine O-methyltransferase Ste14
VLLIVIGAWAALSSSRELGKAFTAMPEPVRGAELVESGWYSRARHPIYGALLLIGFGASILLASRLGALTSVSLGVVLWMKSGYEERRLRIAYPKYSAYRRRVTKRFFPFLV